MTPVRASTPTNIILNPSFENGVYSNGIPMNWDFATCEGVANATVALDPTTYVDGNHSAKVYSGPVTPTGCFGPQPGRQVGFTQFRQFLASSVNFTDLTDSPDGFSFWFKLQPYNNQSGMGGFGIRVFGAESLAELVYAINPDPSLGTFANYTGVHSLLFYGYQPGQWYHFSRNLRADWANFGLSLHYPLSLIQFQGYVSQSGTTVKSETFWLDDVRAYADPPDFTITVNPQTLILAPNTILYPPIITLTSLNSFAGTVQLSAQVSPPGLGVTLGNVFSTADLTLTGNRQNTTFLVPRTTSSSHDGTYHVNVTGVSGSTSHSVNLTVIVVGWAGRWTAGWATSPPAIDGTLSVNKYSPSANALYQEWESALAIGFNVSYSTGNPISNGTLYVMNDANNLYLAVKIQDSNFNAGDNLDLFFDNNNTGVQTSGDAVFQLDINSQLTSGNGFFDEFWNSSFGPTGRALDTAFGGTTDGAGAGSGDGRYNYFEISHPLSSGDTRHDFSLKPGDAVGLLLGYNDDGRLGSYWPSRNTAPNYPLRAQIRLATATMPNFELIKPSYYPQPIPVPVPSHDYSGMQLFVASLWGLTGQVSLSASVNTTGLVVGLQTPVLTLIPQAPFLENYTWVLFNATRRGFYDVTITGTFNTFPGPMIHSVDVYVNATAMTVGDFTVNLVPGGITAGPGTNTTATVFLSSFGNFTGNVGLGLNEYPPNGVNFVDARGPPAFFDSVYVHLAANGTGTSTLTIRTLSDTSRGTWTLQTIAHGGFIHHQFNFTLFVPLPDFTVRTSASLLTIAAGGSTSLTVALASLYGFDGTVQLSSSSPLAFFNPGGINLTRDHTGTVTLKIVTTTNTTPGNYTVIIKAGSGATSHNVILQVTVTAPPQPLSTVKTTILGLDPTLFYALATALTATVLALVTVGLIARRKPSEN